MRSMSICEPDLTERLAVSVRKSTSLRRTRTRKPRTLAWVDRGVTPLAQWRSRAPHASVVSNPGRKFVWFWGQGCSFSASISTGRSALGIVHLHPHALAACPLFDAKLMDGVRIGELPL